MAPQRDQFVIGEPCEAADAKPLRIVARLTEGIVLRHPLMLDALLAWAVANQDRSLPPLPGENHARVEIPIAREPDGRFHLCSQGYAVAESFELRYKNRRAPIQEMARLGSRKLARVSIATGANKSYRVPYELQMLSGNQIEWWCLGDAARIRELLWSVHYLGKHRGSGKGRLDIHGTPWTVELCEPWDGFPVLRDGMPLRQLPIDWPGLSESSGRAYRTLSFPYFDHTAEEELACP